MVKSKTKISQQLKRKTNTHLVETLILAKKNSAWIEVASILSGPRRKRIDINLNDLNKFAKEGEKIIVPGKILSQGFINKKIEVIAFAFSERAEAKLKDAGCKSLNLLNEIKSNPDAKGIKVFKNAGLKSPMLSKTGVLNK